MTTIQNNNFKLEAYDNYFYCRNMQKDMPPADGLISSDKKFEKFVAKINSIEITEQTTWSDVMNVVISSRLVKNISYRD